MAATKQYRNGFYHKGVTSITPEFFNADPDKEDYKGYEIHQWCSTVFHIVKDGLCVGMMAGKKGAKARIDKAVAAGGEVDFYNNVKFV